MRHTHTAVFILFGDCNLEGIKIQFLIEGNGHDKDTLIVYYAFIYPIFLFLAIFIFMLSFLFIDLQICALNLL